MEITIFILSTLCLIQFVCIVFLSNFLIKNIKEGKNKIEELEGEVEEFNSIIPGDKVFFNYNLITWENNNKDHTFSFNVDYEADVIEVAKNKLKVNAYLVVGVNQAPDFYKKDPNYKSGLITFMTGKWINRKDVNLLMDQEYIRDRKLNKLLK